MPPCSLSWRRRGPSRRRRPRRQRRGHPRRRKVPKPPPVTSLDVIVTDPAGKPVEGALVLAVPTQGAVRPFGGFATEKIRSTLTGKEGKAKLESLPPGPWNVVVQARGYVRQPLRGVASGPLVVRLEKGGSITGVVREGRTAGLSDLRVEMERGLELRGRVVDTAGRPAPNLDVVATDAGRVVAENASTLADGSFRMGGLGEEPYTLVSGGDLAGWAVRGGVTPGGDPVTLALRPGGRVAVRVLDADGRPVKDAYPDVLRVDGLAVTMPGGSGATDANGFVEIGTPAGLVEVEAGTREQTGRGSVTVTAGATAPLEIVLQAQAPKLP